MTTNDRVSALIYFPGASPGFVVLFVLVFGALILAHYWFDETTEKKKQSLAALILFGILALATYPLTGSIPLTVIGFALAGIALFDVLFSRTD